MKPSTKKFIKWLLIADVVIIFGIMILGFIFIDTNVNARMNLLGQGTGQFIFTSNIAAFLIFFGIRKLRNK